MVDVGERRHDEQRLRVEGGAVGAQHDAGLLGVGGTGDEGEGHGTPQGCSWSGGQAATASARANDTLGELERCGYIERHPDPQDGRARIVRLTDRERALQAAAHQTSRRLERAWADIVGEERFADLRTTLEDMIAASSVSSRA